jgi:hypothetical protein
MIIVDLRILVFVRSKTPDTFLVTIRLHCLDAGAACTKSSQLSLLLELDDKIDEAVASCNWQVF